MLQRIITPKGFRELQAYYSLYPHYTERFEAYLVQIAWWVSNSIERKEGVNPPGMSEFFFDFDNFEEVSGSNRQSSKAMEKALLRAAKLYGKHQQNFADNNG